MTTHYDFYFHVDAEDGGWRYRVHRETDHNGSNPICTGWHKERPKAITAAKRAISAQRRRDRKGV